MTANLADPKYDGGRWTSAAHKLYARTKPGVRLDPKKTALFIVDMQKGDCLPEAPLMQMLKREVPEGYRYYMERLKTIVPNLQRLQSFFRKNNMEVIQCVGHSKTLDGRDKRRGVSPYPNDYPNIGPGSIWAEVIDEIKPEPNELVLVKQRASMFLGYDTYYVLQNMGIEYILFGGMVSDGCVHATVTDAKGFFGSGKIIVVEDCCAAFGEEDHVGAIREMGGWDTITSAETAIKHLTEQLELSKVAVR